MSSPSTPPASSRTATGSGTTATTRAGTPCGTSRSARHADGWRAEFRIPFSQLRFDPASSAGFGFAVVRQVAHENETSTWPLLARSASGYVSSFGDLTGLAFSAGQKRLELMPYAVGEYTTSPVAAGNPLNDGRDGDAAVGLDLKYRVTPGLMLTGDRQSGLRAGRSRSRRGQPRRVRDVFLRAASVLRRRIRQLRVRPRLQRRRLHGALLFAPHRPHAASDGRRAGERLRRSAAQLDDSRRRQTDRPHGQFLDRRAQRHHQPRNGHARVGRRAGHDDDAGRTGVELFSGAGEPRVREQLTAELHAHQHQPAPADELRFLPSSATTGGMDTDMRLGGGVYNLRSYLGRQRRARQCARDRSPAAQQRPQLSAARRDASHLRSRQRSAGRLRRRRERQQDQRPAHAVHVRRLRTRRRVST